MSRTLSPRVVKFWRLARRWPHRAWRDWWTAFVNEGQLLSLALAGLTSWIGLRTATLPEVMEEATGWAHALQATIYVAFGWFLICAVRAPFMLLADDRKLGRWHGDRYVYHQRKLVGTFRCKATGDVQTFPVQFYDAAPNAFVYYEIDVGNGKVPDALYTATLVGGMVLSSTLKPGLGTTRGGIRIGRRMDAVLFMVMKPEAVSQTVRVYCLDFSIGNPSDKDGDTGQPWPPALN